MSPERKAWAAGALVLVLGAAARWANGMVYSQAEAKDLIATLSKSGLYLGSAMATSSGTTLALMLTLIGLVRRANQDFGAPVYRRINNVSLLSTLSLIGSVFLLLALTMPVGEFERLPNQWYPTLYNTLYGMVVGLGGLLVGTVVLLYGTIQDLIANIAPGADA